MGNERGWPLEVFDVGEVENGVKIRYLWILACAQEDEPGFTLSSVEVTRG